MDKKDLMERYSDYLLTEGKRPVNVYTFAKQQGFEESDFYHHFSGFEALEKEYLGYFFDQSRELATKMEGYADFSWKEKLLNLYYVFIENLTMNRSLVLMILNVDFKSRFRKLKHLKKRHKEFIQSLDIQDWSFLEKMPEQAKKYTGKPKEELLWFHFLSVIKFWIEDQSPDFENTDLYIEKSIDTGVELIDSPFPEKLFDLSRFLWKEKF